MLPYTLNYSYNPFNDFNVNDFIIALRKMYQKTINRKVWMLRKKRIWKIGLIPLGAILLRAISCKEFSSE